MNTQMPQAIPRAKLKWQKLLPRHSPRLARQQPGNQLCIDAGAHAQIGITPARSFDNESGSRRQDATVRALQTASWAIEMQRS